MKRYSMPDNYDHQRHGYGPANIVEDDAGKFVCYEDAAHLESEIARLQAEVDQLRGLLTERKALPSHTHHGDVSSCGSCRYCGVPSWMYPCSECCGNRCFCTNPPEVKS